MVKFSGAYWGVDGWSELASLFIQETEDGRMVIIDPDPEDEWKWTDNDDFLSFERELDA